MKAFVESLGLGWVLVNGCVRDVAKLAQCHVCAGVNPHAYKPTRSWRARCACLLKGIGVILVTGRTLIPRVRW